MSCFSLFVTFFKIAFFTLGGGPVMLVVMDEEFRKKRNLLTEKEMNAVFAVIYSMPGAIGVNAAIHIGNLLRGKRGVASALAGVIIPPVCIILFVASYVELIKDSPLTGYAFTSIRAAVSAFIICTMANMMKKSFRSRNDVVVAVTAFVAVAFIGIPAIYVIILSGLLGIFLYRKEGL